MKNGYEYYYLLGLDLNLEDFGLGTIKQPKLIDFLNKDINIEGFYTPFIMNDYILGQSNDKGSFEDIKKQIGSLSFLFMTCYQSNRADVINSILECLSFLYGTEAKLGDALNIIVGDVNVTNDNFDTLCSVVLEMMRIDKSKIRFDKKEDNLYQDISDKMLEAKKKFLERNKKGKKNDSPLTIADISNIIIHSNIADYDKVMNMTIYQIKNSFETINAKESFDISTLYRVSPKFDMSKEKFEHWTEKIKLDKSVLSQDND
ncbi:MAG: hypothetical protein ACRDDY_19610 [Clostridium sp.]|uniref:hypothetical protein n=1 Tax=Clostridium sp. TaxID=1506 RepID=UPI003EE448C4